MQKRFILSLVILLTAMLYGGNPEQKKKAAGNASPPIENSNNSSISVVSFVTASGDTIFKILENGKVIADSITADSLAVRGTVSAGAFIGDGSGLTGLPSAGWGLSGNSGIDTTINFIGTTDDLPLDFKVNNQPAMRLEYVEGANTRKSVNIISGYKSNTIASGSIGSTISGGSSSHNGPNSITGDFSTIGGGSSNVIAGYGSVISGGQSNDAIGNTATVGGGIAMKPMGMVQPSVEGFIIFPEATPVSSPEEAITVFMAIIVWLQGD